MEIVGGRTRSFGVLLAAVVLLALPALAAACPMCKEALFDPGQLPQRLSTARGYALSIGVLLLVPLSLIVSVVMLIMHAKRPR